MTKTQTPEQDTQLYTEVKSHYAMWTKDNEQRMNRKNGWNEVTDAYWGKLPDNWPYISHTVIPVLRTSLIEKNGRLLNSKLQGRLIPREGGDHVSAILNNAILDYQWDSANFGGSMLTKFEVSDMDTRLYASKFAYIYWRYEVDESGKVIFDGNEMMPLDIRDCGMDTSAGVSNVKGASWFQVRTWEKLEDLEGQTLNGKPMFQNLDKLKTSLLSKANKKSSTRPEYTPRVLQLQGLTDHTGKDIAFPVVKLVTEYRPDRWITFSPDFDLILRDIPNPYNHHKIPIAQLKYYPIQDDPLGESEVEAVLPLWLAIQATVCAYLDEMILKIRPPLKVIENAARVETIQYGPEAQWLVDRQDAIEEMGTTGSTLQYFQTSYQVLTNAFNLAMGDLSENTSQFDPFSQSKKTATEIRTSSMQQNSRDQKNQNDMVEFIKDIMLMWVENNKQFLFSDPNEVEHILRIVGTNQFAKLKQMGLDDMVLVDGAEDTIADVVAQMGGDITDNQIEQMYNAATMPKYPVILNPKEKDVNKIQMKPKMTVKGNIADVSIVPADLEGTYDYIPDIKSMSAGAAQNRMQAQQQIIQSALNPMVMQMLYMEGWQLKIKDVLMDSFEAAGYSDAEIVFEQVESGKMPMLGGGNVKETLNYKDLPPDLQQQMAMRAGLMPQPGQPMQPGQQPMGQPTQGYGQNPQQPATPMQGPQLNGQ